MNEQAAGTPSGAGRATMRCALFVDFDNVYSGLLRLDADAAASFAKEPARWLERLSLGEDDDGAFGRRFLVRACYLNPTVYSEFRPYFMRAGFRVIDCPSLTSQGKSSADINLVLDAVDALNGPTRYEEFVIFSADADFTPLALRCRAQDRRVTVALAGPAAGAYRAVADTVIAADQLAELLTRVDPSSGGNPGGVNYASFDKWQPKATLSYKPSDTANFYVSYGEGFRSGQFNQNGTAAAAQAAGLAGVSDEVPQENTGTYEIGTKLQLANRRVVVDAALFDTTVENQQYFVFIGAIGAQVLVPIDRVRLRGGEISATADLGGGLSANASFGYTDGKIRRYSVTPTDIGNDAPYVPKTTINGGLQYRTPITNHVELFTRADYRRLGKQYWDPENTTARSNVDLADFRLGVEDPGGAWSLIGSVENAFDQRYNSEYVLGGFAHAAPPRVWRIDLRYNF